MYESFYHLTDRPFAATPRIDQYYPARAIEAARRTLVRCVDRAEGIGVVVGPSGIGKTLICQLLREHFQDAFDVIMLGATRIDAPRALLQAMLFDLGLPCRGLADGDLRLALVDHLTREAGRAGALLIADEAHTLPARVLEEIRLITNITVAGQPRVRFVMVGGPSLEEHLASPKLESFSQRAAARCYLEPLDRGETAGYIAAQIMAAGGEPRRLFSESALESVYRATDGVPRLINQLCDHALVLAFAKRSERLGEREIEEAWADLQQLPTPWSGSATIEPTPADDVIEFGQLDDEPESFDTGAPMGPRLAAGLDESEADLGTMMDQEMPDLESATIATQHSTSIDLGMAVRPASTVAVTPTANPFGEDFDHEEIVVDRFSSAHAAVWDQMPHVYSSEGRVLAELLQPFVQTAKTTPVAEVTSWSEDEPELIIVEDDPVATAVARPAPSRAYRQEYSQLFAKLRRG